MNGEKKESGKAGSGSAHSGTDKPPLTPLSPLQLPTSPHLFSVLNLLCPPLTDNNAVIPSLQECLKEDEFHRQICCAKKMVRQFMFVLLSILKLILYLPFHSAHKMFSGYFSTLLALHQIKPPEFLHKIFRIQNFYVDNSQHSDHSVCCFDVQRRLVCTLNVKIIQNTSTQFILLIIQVCKIQTKIQNVISRSVPSILSVLLKPQKQHPRLLIPLTI